METLFDSVKCNWCDWQGNEDELGTFNEPNPIDKQDKTLHFFRGCPNCKTDSYLMDIENETSI